MGNEIQISKTGATSSKIPAFHLIPRQALVAMAERFSYGASKHGRDNWRKGTKHPPKTLTPQQEHAVERLGHVIDHCSKLIEKIEGRLGWDGDDDVGAILWGGSFLSVTVPEIQEKVLCGE